MFKKYAVPISAFLLIIGPGAIDAWLSLIERFTKDKQRVTLSLTSITDIYELVFPLIGLFLLLFWVWWTRAPSASKVGGIEPSQTNTIAEINSSGVTVTEDPQGLYGRLKIHNNGDTAHFRAMARFVGDSPPVSRHTTPWAARWRTKDEEYIPIGRDADAWLDVVSRERSFGVPNHPILRFWQATAATGLEMGEKTYSDNFDLWEDEDAVDVEIWVESLQKGRMWNGFYTVVMLNEGARLIRRMI